MDKIIKDIKKNELKIKKYKKIKDKQHVHVFLIREKLFLYKLLIEETMTLNGLKN